MDHASSSPASFSNLGFSLTSVAMFLSFLLRAARLEHADEISLSRGENADDLRERGLQGSDERGLQLRTAGKTSELLHLVRPHRATAHQGAEDLERLQYARLIDKTFRELDLVALSDRDGGRPGEDRAQLALAGLIRGASEQAVLHDVVLDAARAQPAAELLQLAHLQPAVLGHHQRDGPAELPRESFDLLCLRGDPAAFALDLRSGLDLRQAAALLLIRNAFRPLWRTKASGG